LTSCQAAAGTTYDIGDSPGDPTGVLANASLGTTALLRILGRVEIAERNDGTTLGGVTGRGFLPGQSGNPGGRPKGLARRVRELVGNDGEAIVTFMVEVMHFDGDKDGVGCET
jgi:Family of unknown function (DUF5681)